MTNQVCVLVLAVAVAAGAVQAPAPPQPGGAAGHRHLPAVAARRRRFDEGGETVPGLDRAGLRQSADVQSRRRANPVRGESRREADRRLRLRSRGRDRVQLTETPTNENSPTYLPPGLGSPGGFSVVRTEPDKTQRLWRFDARGRDPQVILPDVKPVGYHAWLDSDTVALFVLGPPATLRIANVADGKAEIAAEGIGRSLHRIPGTRAVSFVQRESSGEFWVKQIEVATRKIEPLVKAVEGSTDRDMAWTPDGQTVLMSAGTKVFSWTRGAAGWTEVFDAAAHALGAVSRLAVSPKGDAVAIVVAELKKQAFRSSQPESGAHR